jgi:hypothetical protein
MEYFSSNENGDDEQYDDPVDRGDDFGTDDEEISFEDDLAYEEGDATGGDDYEGEEVEPYGDDDNADYFGDDAKQFDDDNAEDFLSSPDTGVYYKPDLPQLDPAFAVPVASASISNTEKWFEEDDNSAAVPLLAIGAVFAAIAVLVTVRRRSSTKPKNKESYSIPSSPEIKRDLVV